MDDPGWSWPFWKFGLKKDDLFSSLHDQYNTFPSSIQDPEAFHHDVYEISTEASSSDEFHRLMAERKSQRLHELNDLLESASLEIIANPALIGTTQWQHALQLFRTKSLDSLVRYFASYLPENHPWHRGSGSDSSSSSDGESLAASHASSFFDDIEDEHCLTQEPLSINTSIPSHLIPSPRSMTMQSDSSEVSPVDCGHHDYIISTLTPARTLSFSDSEHEEHFSQLKCSVPLLHDDDEETSQSDDAETPGTSISDLSEIHTSQQKELLITEDFDDTIQDEYISITHTHNDTHTQLFTDTMDSETPTPKPEVPSAPATSFFETKLSSLRRRSLSPSRTHPHHTPLSHHDCRKPQRSQRRRECSPDGGWRRRNAVEQGGGRIQKPVAGTLRSRLRERRQAIR